MDTTVITMEHLEHVRELDNVNANTLLKVPNLHIGVYGTLRKGQGAAHLMEDLELKTMAYLCNRYFSLRVVGHGGFPCMLSRDQLEDCVDNEHLQHHTYLADTYPVIELYEGINEDILRRLDTYEGYPSLYQRRVYRCTEEDIHIALYIWNTESVMEALNMEILYNQDWLSYVNFMENRKAKKRDTTSDIEATMRWLRNLPRRPAIRAEEGYEE